MSDARYVSALARLHALAPLGVLLGLESVRAALAYYGNPQEKIQAIHIAGTNGKGSVAAMLDAILRSDGQRVGRYTSPHLHRFVERIAVDGEPADEASVGEALARVLDDAERGRFPSLSFFEAATVAAWLVFARAKIDRVVLEVGLGGRLDATRVCAPERTVITRIALDHQAMLGDTIAKIAGEKAGILENGVPCFVGPSLAEGEAREAIDAVASERGVVVTVAPMLQHTMLGAYAALALDGETATLSLAGEHQAENASIAVAVARSLGVSERSIAEGLRSTRWPARLERVGNLLLDGAHNPDGVTALLAALSAMSIPSDKRALLFGASSDKDWRASLDALSRWCDPSRWALCAAAISRAEAPSVLAAYKGGRAFDRIEDALDAGTALAGKDGTLLVCGSLFVVAAARAIALSLESDPPVALLNPRRSDGELAAGWIRDAAAVHAV